MKTKKWMMLAAGVIMTTTPLFAQFNTVMPGRTTGVSESVSLKDDDMGNRQGKAFMEGCLSEEKSAPASSGEAGKEKWVQRYLSVCYPLRKMKVNSPYGYRTDPFTVKRKFHNGIDLHARGDKVLAMMEGEVVAVGQDKVSGKYVTLRHGRYTVSYCHLSKIFVGKGMAVHPRDAVGVTGSTGRSTGEHLHITCKLDGRSVDPLSLLEYVKATQQECVAALAVL